MTIELGSHAEIERALILGLARQPLSVPDGLAREDETRSRLGYLALVAARRRFARPAPPADLEPASGSAGAPRFPGWETRVRLRRLFAGHVASERKHLDVLALRVRDAMRAHGWAVHPFDVPVLGAFLRAGAAEEASAPSTENWSDLSPNARAGALAALRRADPAQARAHCAAEIADQTAAVRNKWLAALETRLGPDDVEFLEAQLGDRAASVVARATELLARIPGTRWHDERLAEARSRLRKKTGRLRRQAQLVLETPADADQSTRWGWVRESFASLAPAALAASFDLAAGDLPRAVEDDDLRRALYLAAVDARDASLAEALAAEFDGVDLELALGDLEGAPASAAWDETQLDLAARTVLRSGVVADPLGCRHQPIRFYEALRRPLPEDVATRLLEKARSFERRFRGSDDADTVVEASLAWLVVLPAALRSRVVDASDALPGPRRREVLDYCNVLEEIEKRA
ncbi:MAG: DUF5691 domain-containing protein [Myxococcota bacterium]|nr:DUF5691 domain-containing protein [Myxococcota bacterium]